MDTCNGKRSVSNVKNIWRNMISSKIKELQKLYSWNQFYQDRKMKAEMKKCQTEIHQLKNVINELKSKKK